MILIICRTKNVCKAVPCKRRKSKRILINKTAEYTMNHNAPSVSGSSNARKRCPIETNCSKIVSTKRVFAGSFSMAKMVYVYTAGAFLCCGDEPIRFKNVLPETGLCPDARIGTTDRHKLLRNRPTRTRTNSRARTPLLTAGSSTCVSQKIKFNIMHIHRI